ncbi:hypothetical protein BC830DRAFT_890737 [Chytriomyces sp. MP71]|nr:hypothetical protein BC830DRAFT_890737 [Chytriomyces sp. MP71]
MPGIFSRLLDHGPEPIFVPEEERSEDILYTKEGYEVSGKLTRDRTIVWAGVGVFCILFCSWTAQWVAFALPNWRGDQYHTGGLFQICGTQDLLFNPQTDSLMPNPAPNATHSYRCQSIQEYASDLQSWTCGYGDNDACNAARLLPGQITASRWFESATTVLDMIFGVTTISFMLWPDRSPKKSLRNGWIALLGIILTPWMCLIDLFIQNGYWDRVGVGLFDSDVRNFLHGAAQATIATSTIDFAVQFGFLQWAVHRHGWKFVGHNAGEVSMGPSLQMRSKRSKRNNT